MSNGGSQKAFSPIVVGVDGSASSIQALRWAVAHAAELASPVEAVFVLPSGPSIGAPAPCAADELSVVQAASDELARTVLRAVGESEAEAVAITVLSGSSSSAGLGEVTGRAAYLVLGARHLAQNRAAEGSSAASLLQRAHCPVIFIPSDDRPVSAPAA